MMMEGLLVGLPQRDELEYERAIAFSQLGDQLFDELADKIATKQQHRLLFEHRLKPELFQQIQVAAAGYISACLNSPIILSEDEMLNRLLEARNSLPNYTGTGLLMPKREHTLAFNLFQKSVAEAFCQLGANDLIDAVDLPVNLRMVYGKTDIQKTSLPFASSKCHSDVWAGVPADATVPPSPLLIKERGVRNGRGKVLYYTQLKTALFSGQNLTFTDKPSTTAHHT
jgi:hypothetical protein